MLGVFSSLTNLALAECWHYNTWVVYHYIAQWRK